MSSGSHWGDGVEGDAISLADVSVWVPDRIDILRHVNWTVGAGERWALLGPNGSGKSTLLSVVQALRFPSSGSSTVLGCAFGACDIPEMRKRIGVVDPSQRMLEWLTVEELALTGVTNTIRPIWDAYGDAELRNAREALSLVGCDGIMQRPLSTCSQGERQRARLARALVTQPDLLLLDEPAVGLDLPAREALILSLDELARSRPRLTTVLVTHHPEEIPSSTTHAMLLRGGEIVAAGNIAEVLCSASMTACFGMPIDVTNVSGRWYARAEANWERSGSAAVGVAAESAAFDDSEGF